MDVLAIGTTVAAGVVKPEDRRKALRIVLVGGISLIALMWLLFGRKKR